MRFYYDLHIHSALSPCAENEMTPNNIVNMAALNGLDIIALTDHNTAANVDAVWKCAEKSNVVFIPGIEVESAEEVHVVCLFPDVKSAMRMNDIVKRHLPYILNEEKIFGQQLILDENDQLIRKKRQLLIVSTDLTVDEIFFFVEMLGGCAYYAHVDRESYSVLSLLGTFTEETDRGLVEVSSDEKGIAFAEKRKDLKDRVLLYSSDSHRLADMNGRDNYIELPFEKDELKAAHVISWMRRKSMR